MTNSPTYAEIVSTITNRGHEADIEAVRAWESLRGKVPGWSLPAHYVFFSAALAALKHRAAGPVRVLVCGVYHGFDLALMQSAAMATRCEIDLTGVDLFSDQPCADWTDDQKARGTWEGNGFGPPPSIEAAQRNAPGANVVKSGSVEFMLNAQRLYDFIYLDTSHDYATVMAEIRAALLIRSPDGVLAGDDYYQPNTGWGVDRAVSETLPHHVALWNRIWLRT